MKKILLLIISCLIFAGCNKFDSSDAVKEYKKLLTSNSNYSMKGEMEIISNEETYNYDVVVDYSEGDFYKVTLTNTDNAHEQIILKNENGVYIVTPSLNKSFKFQSSWPTNSSQAYILDSILKDLESDKNLVFEEIKDGYILNTTVNYPNNSNLISQKITFDKNMSPKKVEVLNKEGLANITFTVKELDFKKKFDDKYFAIDSSIDEDCCDESVTSLDEIIYPMYLPAGTTFKGEETIKNDSSERVILTFTGSKPFIMIEEVSLKPKSFEINHSNGDLVFYENILGNITDTSLTWSVSGKDYYIIGENLSTEEILQIASSTSKVSLTK